MIIDSINQNSTLKIKNNDLQKSLHKYSYSCNITYSYMFCILIYLFLDKGYFASGKYYLTYCIAGISDYL